jgi:hypothetical protein
MNRICRISIHVGPPPVASVAASSGEALPSNYELIKVPARARVYSRAPIPSK